MYLKSARHEIIRAFRPNLVFSLKVNGNTLDAEARARTVFFLAMYLMIIVLSTFVVSALESRGVVSLETCAGAVLASISNIGPGLDAVGPMDNFGHLAPATQVFLGWLMLLGRLELFALLVLFFPSAWRRF